MVDMVVVAIVGLIVLGVGAVELLVWFFDMVLLV